MKYFIVHVNGRRGEFRVPTFIDLIVELERRVHRDGPFDLLYLLEYDSEIRKTTPPDLSPSAERRLRSW